MEKVIYDEKNGLWYELQGDYYIPCLKLPEEEQHPIGVWGQRHLRYIKQNRKVLCNADTHIIFSAFYYDKFIYVSAHRENHRDFLRYSAVMVQACSAISYGVPIHKPSKRQKCER